MADAGCLARVLAVLCAALAAEAVVLAAVVATSQPGGAELSGLTEQAAAMEVEDRRGGA